MEPALPEYVWLVVAGAFAAFGFGWGTGMPYFKCVFEIFLLSCLDMLVNVKAANERCLVLGSSHINSATLEWSCAL
jgi:hypothetical protein